MDPQQQLDVDDALLGYWTKRDEAALRQAKSGRRVDAGGRAGVTSGAHLDQVARLLAKACVAAGAPSDEVWCKVPEDDASYRRGTSVGVTLPGFYRPTKKWDVVVYHNDAPIVVVELKSQNGPSYGNNANNRAEEAIGNAVDFARAREAGLIPGDPLIGYVFVIEDDLISARSDRGKQRGRFRQDGIFANCSYIDRVKLLCRRLMDDGYYDAAWAVATSRPSCPGPDGKPIKCPQLRAAAQPHLHKFAWRELDPDFLGYAAFIERIAAQVQKFYGLPAPESPLAANPSS